MADAAQFRRKQNAERFTPESGGVSRDGGACAHGRGGESWQGRPRFGTRVFAASDGIFREGARAFAIRASEIGDGGGGGEERIETKITQRRGETQRLAENSRRSPTRKRKTDS